MKRLMVAFWLIATPLHAGPLDGTETHSFAIIDQQVGDVLREFAGAIGHAVDIEAGVQGRLTNFRGSYTARGFLDAVTDRFGLVWYDDGTAIHISGADTMKSVVIDFDRVAPDALDAALTEMGIADQRFALRRTAAGIGVVTGPPRYVEMVENTFLMLAARKADGPSSGSTREAHNMTVVRGEQISIWRGVVDQVETQAAENEGESTAATPSEN